MTDPRDRSNLVDGVPGANRPDRGDRDTTLTTDDAAQRDDAVAQPDTEAD